MKTVLKSEGREKQTVICKLVLLILDKMYKTSLNMVNFKWKGVI